MYVYKITNNINHKYYIGVHVTNDINDGYMGSGKLIKRAISKYGLDNFTKEIVKEFDDYNECLRYERSIVNEEFIADPMTYNIMLGGWGGRPPQSAIDAISKAQSKNWAENKESIMTKRYASDHYERSSKTQKGVTRANLHNTDPVKIAKMAATHRGMKRTDETKKNQSEAKKRFITENGTAAFGKGQIYINNGTVAKRQNANDSIPDGWYKGNLVLINNGIINKTHDPRADIPTGWYKGRMKKAA